MNRRTRMLIVFGPLAVSATGALALTYPAFLDSQHEHEELAKQEIELQEVKGKLTDKASADASHKALQEDINSLRNEVPHAPYLDLLLLDLERMALASRVDIISVEKQDEKGANNQTPADGADLEVLEAAGLKDRKVNLPAPLQNLSNQVQGQGQNKAKDENKGPEQNNMGVKQLSRRVYITGDYNSLIDFMKRMEAYQRVLSVNSLSIALASSPNGQNKSAAGEKAQKLKLSQPVLSFMLNIYYLP